MASSFISASSSPALSSSSSSSSSYSNSTSRLSITHRCRKLKPKHRKKRHHPATRLGRRTRIIGSDSLCAPFPKSDSRLRGKLQSVFEQERQLLVSHPHAGAFRGHGSPQATLLELTRIDNGDLIEEATEISLGKQDKEECNAVEAGSEGPVFFERHWSEMPASPLGYEGPNVTRAASECSSLSDEYICSNTWETKDWCIKDWKVQAELMMAECSLLRVEKDLAVKRWKQGRVQMYEAARMVQALRAAVRSMPERKKDREEMDLFALSPPCFQNEDQEALDEQLKKIQSTLSCSGSTRYSNFVSEAVKKLKKFRKSSSETSLSSQDLAESLQDKLQNLLLAAESVQRSHEPATSQHAVYDRFELGDISTRFGAEPLCDKEYLLMPTSASIADDKRWSAEMDVLALRKELDFLSLDLIESRAAASLIRKEFRSILNRSQCEQHQAKDHFQKISGEKQAIDEKLYKAAIRNIAAHVQEETEQWSQVQEILHHVQEHMNDLYQSREMWEERARQAESHLLVLQEQVHSWRCRAQSAEKEIAALPSERQNLKKQLEKANYGLAGEQTWRLEHTKSSLSEAPVMFAKSIRNKNCLVAELEVETEPKHKTVITLNQNAVHQVEEKSEHSSAAPRDCCHHVCASITQSRKASSESSCNVSNIQKNIKKSLDFSKIDIHTELKNENQSPTDQVLKVEPTKDDKAESRTVKKVRGRKTAKENGLTSKGASKVASIAVEQFQSGFNNSRENYAIFSSSKSRLSKTATPAPRSPFGDILNTTTLEYHPLQTGF